jgi:hypothetical protein
VYYSSHRFFDLIDLHRQTFLGSLSIPEQHFNILNGGEKAEVDQDK